MTTILICWSFILSPNSLFNIYLFKVKPSTLILINKRVTSMVIVSMFVDPILLAMNRMPNVNLFLSFFEFRSAASYYGLGHNIGIIILLILLLGTLVLQQKFVSSVAKVMFRSFFGIIPFLLLSHIFFVQGDVSRYKLLGVWMYGWIALAIIFYISTVFVEYPKDLETKQ